MLSYLFQPNQNNEIVVKIGTSTPAYPTYRLNIRLVEELCKTLSDLKNAGHEIVIGDNDTLSAIVAASIKADILVLLSDIDGLYTADPHQDPEARLISPVEEITPEIVTLATGSGSELGTGDMIAKIHAEQICCEVGTDRIITMAAGVKMEKITAILGAECPVIRMMPNTAVEVGEGMILYTGNSAVSQEAEEDFLTFMSEAGTLDRLPEDLIDAGSAVSGCGPAFVYIFIEALADGGVKCGLPGSAALRYAEQTVLGASKLAMETAGHPEELKDAVCSPAGSTVEGCFALEKGGFRAVVVDAVAKAFERTKELGK